MIIKQSHRATLVKEYYFSKKLKQISEMKIAGAEIINLGIGNPDLAPQEEVINTLVVSSIDKLNHGYQPYTGIDTLRKAFAEWYKTFFEVKTDYKTEVLPLMGSKEGIMHISLAFLNSGDSVLIPNPGYPTYSSVTKIAGANIIEYNLLEENNWMPDLETIEKQDLSKVKLMWINYPNMPTGKPACTKFYEKVIEFAHRNKILICNDNPYSFILNNKQLSILSVEGAKDVALELNTLSKSQNMAGWRVGVLFAKKEYIKTVLKIKSNMDSGMFLPIQLAAIKALECNKDWYAKINKTYKERRILIWKILDNLNCSYDKTSVGMFVWAKISNQFSSSIEFSDYLLNKYHIFITPGSIFGSNGDRYIRISLCSNKNILLETLKRINSH